MDHVVVVVDADPRWPHQFEEVAETLAPFVEGIVIRTEHVGSTSVPGLAAKPIIDLDLVVSSDEQVADVIGRIESAGYRWVGDLGVTGREAFEAPVTSNLPAHHLYLVVENNRAHCDHWLFRDSLIAYPELRDRYSAIKRENAVLAQGDMDRYVALKAAFVAQVLTAARRERSMPAVTYWEPDLG
jgi:GrpB-like predicted nucleotidyltransferase (UPF0157 family)